MFHAVTIEKILIHISDVSHVTPFAKKYMVQYRYNTERPSRYRTRHFFNNFTTNEDIASKFEPDLPHCVRNVKEKNALLFKFRCNIFIGVRIINPLKPELNPMCYLLALLAHHFFPR